MWDFLLTILGIVLGVLACLGLLALGRWFINRPRYKPVEIADLIQQHLRPVPFNDIGISTREFPYRMRADLQMAIDRIIGAGAAVQHFCGVLGQYSYDSLSLADCIASAGQRSALAAPPQYDEVDIGNQQSVRCLKNALWLLNDGQSKYVVLFSPAIRHGSTTGLQVQIASANTPACTEIAQRVFKQLEAAVLESQVYRGKIISLEKDENSYTGRAAGIKVHKLREVQRDDVILPSTTLELLDRNVIQFVRQRPQLAKYRQATKKGLLFYGPPGTGKTHTIHYLASALPGHTTLLVTAEQVGYLGDYMTLARLLQPSVVVMEDVDLIASNRDEMGVCEEVLLNKLLNEMDGLTEAADILFLLTTNRPEALEYALASRPGRIDQAIEFPLPNELGRAKLIRLYSQGMNLSDEIVDEVVRRTDKVSAAFIKELMRRSVQFHLETNGTDEITLADVQNALDEMLFRGGSLNLMLLGATGATAAAQ